MATVRDVRDYLRVHDRTVRKWLASKRLHYIKIAGCIRIPRAAVEALLAGGAA